jgi:hypothetical protein
MESFKEVVFLHGRSWPAGERMKCVPHIDLGTSHLCNASKYKDGFVFLFLRTLDAGEVVQQVIDNAYQMDHVDIERIEPALCVLGMYSKRRRLTLYWCSSMQV